MRFIRTSAHPNGYRCPGDWQFEAILGRFQARFGRSQFAIWWKYRPIINIGYGYGGRFFDGFWNRLRVAPPPPRD